MLEKLKQGPIGFAKRAISYRSLETARIVQRNLTSIVTGTHAAPGGQLNIPELRIVIDPAKHEDILKALPQLTSLKRTRGAEFSMGDDGDLEILVSGVRMRAETYQDMLTVHEIFDSLVYDVQYRGQAIVWDIGANIGATALFYAVCRGWDVLAYEPFPATAEAAGKNIALNRQESRIELVASGLGGSARQEVLSYHHSWRAGNGLFGNLGSSEVAGAGVDVDVQIQDVKSAWKHLLERADKRPIIAKIDCEGAEYEILPALQEANAFSRIGLLFLEVHRIPNHELSDPLRILLDEGMVLVRNEELGNDLRMIVATSFR